MWPSCAKAPGQDGTLGGDGGAADEEAAVVPPPADGAAAAMVEKFVQGFPFVFCPWDPIQLYYFHTNFERCSFFCMIVSCFFHSTPVSCRTSKTTIFTHYTCAYAFPRISGADAPAADSTAAAGGGSAEDTAGDGEGDGADPAEAPVGAGTSEAAVAPTDTGDRVQSHTGEEGRNK